jgi:putative FmdB family regulatory protein
MPLYEYQCEVCGIRFEVIQKFADAPVAVCKSCGGKVTRLFSAPAIQFKGTGWYITDYGRKGRTDPDSSSSTVASSSSKASDTKADTPSSGSDSSSGASTSSTPNSPSSAASSGGDTK